MTKEELRNYFSTRPIYIKDDVPYYVLGQVDVTVEGDQLVIVDVIDNEEVHEIYKESVTKLDNLILTEKIPIDSDLKGSLIDDYINSDEYVTICAALDCIKSLVNSNILKSQDIRVKTGNSSIIYPNSFTYYDMRLLEFENREKDYKIEFFNVPMSITKNLILMGFEDKLGVGDISIGLREYFNIAKQLKEIL